MVSVVHAVLCSLAFHKGADAYRRENSDKRNVAAQNSEDACAGTPAFVAEAARLLVNGALNQALQGTSPYNTTLHSSEHDVSLWACNAHMDVDASAMASGYDGAFIQWLNCVSSDAGLLTYEARITLGNIQAGGIVDAGVTSLCDLDVVGGNSEMFVGARSSDPGVRIQIVMQKTWIPWIYTLRSAEAFGLEEGAVGGITCSMSNIPELIGTKLEKWCVDVVEWLLDNVLASLLNSFKTILLGMTDDFVNGVLPFG